MRHPSVDTALTGLSLCAPVLVEQFIRHPLGQLGYRPRMVDLDDLAPWVGVEGPVKPPITKRVRGAGGIRLNAFDWQGAGPDCVFLHGGAMSAQTWTPCCLILRERYRCISLDLRGHGDSEWSDDYAVGTHVSDLLAVLSQLDLSSPHIVGMSLGGVVAAHAVAAAEAARPKSLTLIDVAPGVSFEGVGRIRQFMDAEKVRNGPKALVEEALKLGAPQSPTELLYRYWSLTRQGVSGEWTWKHDTRRPTDFDHILDHIARLADIAPGWTVPCLLVRGERSKILSEAAAKAFVQRCQKCLFASVSKAGHSVQEDNPRELCDVLERFWTTQAPEG